MPSDSVVFMSGDHGPASFAQMTRPPGTWSPEEILERLAIFSAYRVPSGCPATPDDGTPVNGLRRVVDCVLGTALGTLPDRSFLMQPVDPFPSDKIVEVDVPR